MNYYFIQDGRLRSTLRLPTAYSPLLHNPHILPPMITELHQNFQAWGVAGYTPGPVIGERVWFGQDGGFAVANQSPPRPLNQVGLAPDLAAWLVLLDKYMETFVVVARARSVWPLQELAAALPFMTPAFLPEPLVAQNPDNWARVAQALAEAILDGPLRVASQDRHWRMHS